MMNVLSFLFPSAVTHTSNYEARDLCPSVVLRLCDSHISRTELIGLTFGLCNVKGPEEGQCGGVTQLQAGSNMSSLAFRRVP